MHTEDLMSQRETNKTLSRVAINPMWWFGYRQILSSPLIGFTAQCLHVVRLRSGRVSVHICKLKTNNINPSVAYLCAC